MNWNEYHRLAPSNKCIENDGNNMATKNQIAQTIWIMKAIQII